MNTLVVRRLLVDLDAPIALRWNGGDAFRSALFNALSFSFPVGEQFFIDSIKLGIDALPADERVRFEPELRAFIGQEATHRRIHERMNAQLEAQGLVNTWAGRVLRRRRLLEGKDPRGWVGVTAATEHWTAILSEYLLSHPQLLQGTEPRLADLWRWHCSEEMEHRSTAFDLYRAMGGNEKWRRRLFYTVSFNFAVDVTRQTLANLWRSGDLFRRGTWSSAWHTMLGREGLLRYGWPRWRAYLRADFHPMQGDGAQAERWLAEHAALAPPVQRP